MKEKLRKQLNKIKTYIYNKLKNSSTFNTEPPASVLKIVSKISFYSFILFAASIILLIIRLVQMALGITSFIYFGFIYVLIIIGFAFYILKRMYIKSYNEGNLEVVEGLVLQKKKNKLTRQRWITFKTNSGIEREIEITKKTKVKKGGVYEFCIVKPTEERKEMLLSAEFIKYNEETPQDIEEELIDEE